MSSYSVYIVHCADHTFYTGIATNVQARVLKHNKGKGAKYTKTRLPVRLVYQSVCGSRSEALKREYEIKQLSRRQKQTLVTAIPTQ